MPEETKHAHPQKSAAGGWQLIAVQSISCAVVLLIVLIFRLIGGSAFSELRQSFHDSMMNNSFISTITTMLKAPPDESSIPSETDPPAAIPNASDVSKSGIGGQDLPVSERRVLYAPSGTSFLPLTVDRIAFLPLEQGQVSSVFGYRSDPLTGEDSFHQGLDIAAEYGKPIHALFFGVVKETGSGGSYGNYIIINHGDGLEVMYAHCSEVVAAEGAIIRAGEVVAKVGSTGRSSGNHLHVEIKKDGTAHDPSYIVPLSAY